MVRKGFAQIRLPSGDIVRAVTLVLFFIHEGQMVLLHGFIKKTQQTPDQELDLAVKRKKEIENDGKTKE